MKKKKKINVIITTFNQEKYIAKCLESVLCQRGDFVLDVIIADDKSMDQNMDIIKSYVDRHTNIRVLPSTSNVGMVKNIQRSLMAVDGDYFAFCEGDDYWIDEYKLQKQMDAMDANPSWSMCFNTILIYIENEKQMFADSGRFLLDSNTLPTDKLIANDIITNFSCCFYRASVLKDIDERVFTPLMADWAFNIEYSRHGDIGYILQPLSVYRVNSNSQFASLPLSKKIKLQMRNIDEIINFFGEQYVEHFTRLRDQLEKNLNKIKKNANLASCKYYLFGFLPLLEIQTIGTNKSWVKLFGCIPLLKIKG